MGLCRILSRSSYDSTASIGRSRPLPNPNPLNFQITRAEQVGSGLVLEVLYPDCTNYEGRKVLVYDGVTLGQLHAQGSLDPHFSDNAERISPMARFEPTERGWALALQVAGLI